LYDWEAGGSNPATKPEGRLNSYETIAPCGQTNIGGAILTANNALTDPVDVRREAVWVMVVLSDGAAANVTNKVEGITDENTYGYYGYCPWYTFCYLNGDDWNPGPWPECAVVGNNPSQAERALPICNDNDPLTRHFCLNWETGQPVSANPECGVYGKYDADDYARDMADFAGLIEVDEDVPGNYIAMFSIAFGAEAEIDTTGVPLLRYIADAGDNGIVDNDIEQGLRGDPPSEFGEPGPCDQYTLQKTQNCGQYYHAADLAGLTDVFEEIAGRLFTRLSR
jgi:hypothetical protein